jgi:cation diffusion facilitator family transporter
VTQNQRYQVAKRVTLVGAFINTFLGVFKVIVGTTGHSQALVADGLHSFSDLVTDAFVLIASRYGSQEADDSHPYGHQRIETAATLFISLLLVFVGAGIILDALVSVKEAESIVPSVVVIWAAVFSIFANEGLYHYTRYYGKKINSELLEANAWHHRSDAISSLIVLIGVIGDRLGVHVLDEVAAIIVALLIIKMGVKLIWRSLKELVDSGVDKESLQSIREIIKSTPEVVELHELRTRSMAGRVYVDVHVIVNPYISVSEGHQIGQVVLKRLKTETNFVKDVTVHIDAENDDAFCATGLIPLRNQIEALLREKWQSLPGFEQIVTMNFHYLKGQLEVDVIFNEDVGSTHSLVPYHSVLEELDYLKTLRFFFKSESV